MQKCTKIDYKSVYDRDFSPESLAALYCIETADRIEPVSGTAATLGLTQQNSRISKIRALLFGTLSATPTRP